MDVSLVQTMDDLNPFQTIPFDVFEEVLWQITSKDAIHISATNTTNRKYISTFQRFWWCKYTNAPVCFEFSHKIPLGRECVKDHLAKSSNAYLIECAAKLKYPNPQHHPYAQLRYCITNGKSL